MDEPTPFTLAVPEVTLADLRARLDRTRWFDEFGGGDWLYGVSGSYLQELCDYWRTTFDWRAQEAVLNSFEQFVAVSDGQPIHYIHARSPEPGAVPLLLVHGWPGVDRVREHHNSAEPVRQRRPLAQAPGPGSPPT